MRKIYWLTLCALIPFGCKDPPQDPQAIEGKAASPHGNSAKPRLPAPRNGKKGRGRGLPSFEAAVIRVSDGDTIVVRKLADEEVVKIRLFSVDAPELAQPFGDKAKAFVKARVDGRTVRIDPLKKDRYGRTVARVTYQPGGNQPGGNQPGGDQPGGDQTGRGQPGRDLANALLDAGLAWHYARYDRRQEPQTRQNRARSLGRGLWAKNKPTAPWAWRKARRAARQGMSRKKASRKSSGRKPRPRTPFVGNVRSKVFHHMSCNNADCRNCTVPIKSRSQGVSLGYRPHLRCVRAGYLRLR